MSSCGPGNSDETGTDATSLKATYAGAKRRIATLKLQLKTIQELGTKKKS
jgi:hypothetical protein